jgi:protein arginine N-methyltransferase 1
VSSVKYYRDLLTQSERIEAFRRAIHAAVRPGDRVLEVGTGLGTFAFFAADTAATTVWAVEGAPVAHVARTIAKLNGYHHVQVVRGWLPEVDLPERADVIIFEDFAPRLVEPRVCRLFEALHEKYAAAGARFVPAGADLFCAPVSSEDLWREVLPFPDGEARYGIDWSPSREYVANAPVAMTISLSSLAAAPARFCNVKFDRRDSLDLYGRAEWKLTRDAVLHGLAYWFELDLGGGERLSNAPGAHPASWGQLFLPIDPPLQGEAGSTVSAIIRCDALADGTPAYLSWKLKAGAAFRRGHEFAAEPASLADLVATSSDGVPRLDRRGRLEAKILTLTNGARSVSEIAAQNVAGGDDLSRAEAERLVVRVLFDKIEKAAGAAPLGRDST